MVCVALYIPLTKESCDFFRDVMNVVVLSMFVAKNFLYWICGRIVEKLS